ncbi:MAG: hypothetical protein KGL77_03570 [Actinomycetales bacterium]|nr:hypothetical protein [Actinomycetales bacterium]
MHSLLTLLAATPVPTESADPAKTFYSPGTLGFIMTFFVSAAAIALIFDMVRRVRRVRYRAEIEAKLDAEAAAPVAPVAPKAPAAKKPAAPKSTDAKPAAKKPASPAKPARPAAPPKPKRD